MPIYEYQCKQCGVRLEKRRSVNDPPLVVCEECGGSLEKQWSLSGFQFKGEGWYVTDYSKNKSPKGTGSDVTEKSAANESTPSSDTASKPSSGDSPVTEPASSTKKT